MAYQSEEHIEATFQGSSLRISLTEAKTVSELVARLENYFGIVNVKVVAKGGKAFTATSTSSLKEAGLRNGSKVMVLGSTESEVQKVLNSRDLPGMASFDHELRTLAARRKRDSSQAIQLPSGPYTFGSYETLKHPGLYPPPLEAVKLLHKLAADPGIADVMKQNRWHVGKLSEMPPEGKEGLETCILGVNINAGQEISLRLRTDDLKGFRKYLSIRDTLCHELAHMVHGDHDNKFKTLNSQIRHHVEKLTSSIGKRMLEAAAGWELEAPSQPETLMGSTAASSGKTLRQLAAESHIEIQGIGHRDPDTEKKEKALERLSGLDTSTAESSEPSFTQAGSAVPLRRAQADAAQANVGEASTAKYSDNSHPQLSEKARVVARQTPRQEGTAAGPDMHPQAGAGPVEDHSQSDSAPTTFPGKEDLSSVRHAPNRMQQETAAEQSISRPEEDRLHRQQNGFGAAGEVELPMSDAAEGVEDGSAAYLANARNAVNTILRSASQQSLVQGLSTLLTILKNALEHPGDPKYRKIKLQNPAFQQKAGQLPGSLELLKNAGFVLKQESGEQILRLEREDPGLLWLSLAACEQALQRVA